MGFWQLLLLLGSGFLVGLAVLRGTLDGVVRQAVSLLALFAAWWAGVHGAGMAGAFFRPVGLPDFLLDALGGIGIGLLVYGVLTAIGAVLFKKTGQQESLPIKAIYALGGAALGLVWGLALVWVFAVGARLLGTVAEAEIAAARSGDAAAKPSGPLVAGLAGVKAALEEEPAGPIVRQIDPLPPSAYELLAKITRMASSPKAIERFLSYGPAGEIAAHPKIAPLRENPEIMESAKSRDYLALIRHPAVVEAANDPGLRELIGKFDFPAALDYALGESGGPPRDGPPGKTGHEPSR